VNPFVRDERPKLGFSFCGDTVDVVIIGVQPREIG
jgi:hypothetical protein